MSGIFDQIINYSPPLIVSGTVNYKGTWNASTNNPTLNSSPAASTKGDYYVVSTAGTQFGITFAIGDWIISNGTAWEKVDLTDSVSSVFGRTGAVVGVSTDYSAVGLTNTAIGASNPSTGAFTTVTATTPIAGASGGTGVNNGANTITIAGNVTHAGAFTQTFTATANTSLTLPITGTLATLAGSEALSNKTITSSAFNGTVGATTPSTIAATTGTFNSGISTGFTAAVPLGSANSFLQIGYLSGAITSTTDSFVAWASGSGTALNPSATNGSLILAARNSAGAEVVLAAGNTPICRVASTGLAVTGNTKSTFPGSTGGSSGYGFWAQDSTDASGAGFAGFAKASGTVIGSITRVTTTDAVVYNTTSDGRLKENLRDFTDSGRLIDSLKPRVFDWKNSDENGKNVVGFVAQEEHAADPIFAHIGAVSVGDEDPETITKQWQRSDSALIPILVAELKNVRQRLAALETK